MNTFTLRSVRLELGDWAFLRSVQPILLALFMCMSIGMTRAADQIELQSFTGQAFPADGIVILKWSTLTEQDNRSFEIQRSVGDVPNWETLTIVDAQGTSSIVSHYSHIDANPISGTASYRLVWLVDDVSRHADIIVTYKPQVALQNLAERDANVLSFKGVYRKVAQVVQMRWSTEGEIGSDEFKILRSQNLEDWEKIAVVNGAGNSSELIEYDYTDREPISGVTTYKLTWNNSGVPMEASFVVAVNPLQHLRANGTDVTDFTGGFVSKFNKVLTGGFVSKFNKVQLKWSTTAELNNERFTVFRSKDRMKWESAGNVEGAGTSTHTNNYNLDDRDFINGTSFYKLEWSNGDQTSEQIITVVAETVNFDALRANGTDVTDFTGGFVSKFNKVQMRRSSFSVLTMVQIGMILLKCLVLVLLRS